MNIVSGVDHVGLGVKDRELMKSFYMNVLGFNRVFGEMPEEDHPPIHAVLRTSPAILSAVHLCHESGGIAIALFHKTNPPPRPVRADFKYGDIGVNKIVLSVSDLGQTYRDLLKVANFITEPKSAMIPGWGEHHFIYCKDPEGNLIEFISGASATAKVGPGGVPWIGIGVSDLERSKAFYRKHLGFDQVVIENHEAFSGLVDVVSGAAGARVRSCLLKNSESSGMIEIFETLKPRGRSIPFGVQWGDYGYLQTCFNVNDINMMKEYCEAAGMDILVPPQIIDDPEHSGGFMYIRDPDGILVEFVQFS